MKFSRINFYHHLGGAQVLPGILGTPVKLKIQHIELETVQKRYFNEEDHDGGGPWTADSITSMYLSRATSTDSLINRTRALALKNVVGLPPLRVMRTSDLWVSSSTPLSVACQRAAAAVQIHHSKYVLGILNASVSVSISVSVSFSIY